MADAGRDVTMVWEKVWESWAIRPGLGRGGSPWVQAWLGRMAGPPSSMGVGGKRTERGCLVTILVPGHQVAPSPRGFWLQAKSTRPAAAPGLAHAARPAYPAFPEICVWVMDISAAQTSPFDKRFGDSIWVGKLEVTPLRAMLGARNRAPTVCWALKQTFPSRNSFDSYNEALRVDGIMEKQRPRDAS